MAKPSARSAALAALRTWRKQKQPADSVIDLVLTAGTLNRPDRAFALELFYGTLRNLSLLDFWIAQLRKGKLEIDLRDVLRLGLYQLFIASVPEHAAVHETVDLANKNLRGIVNGILRTAIRNRDELKLAATSQPSSVQFSHPQFLIERWQNQFGEDVAQDLCLWNNRPPALYARVNLLKTSISGFLLSYPGSSVLPNLTNFVGLPNLPQTAIQEGECYIQDPSTRIACELLKPKPDENILDACAAPGGKTSYIAELMGNRGAIVACDRSTARIGLLNENIQRLGVKNTQLVRHNWTNEDSAREIHQAAPFDRVLVDAPCTNTGVMRRRVDVRWRLLPEEFERMQKEQIQIVRAVLPLLKPGGVLVYSTCSLEPEENQMVVRHLLDEMSILRLEAEKDSLPFRDGFDGAYAARLIKAD